MNGFKANPKLQAIIEAATLEAMDAVMLLASKAIKVRLKTPPTRTGRIYRKKGGRMHRASRAGEPPAVDTGTLRRSWGIRAGKPETIDGVVTRSRSSSRYTLSFGSRLDYAKIDSGYGRVAARPYIQNSLAIVRREIPKIAARAFAYQLKKSAGK